MHKQMHSINAYSINHNQTLSVSKRREMQRLLLKIHAPPPPRKLTLKRGYGRFAHIYIGRIQLIRF